MSFGIEELQAVERVMNSGNLSGFQGNFSDQFYGGDEVKALEKEWSEYFGVKHSISCNSATSGLWASCAAIGLKSGDEVLVSPYTMTCSASVPLLFGAKPVFVDIEPDYFCVDPAKMEALITERTKAIIAVDIFGQPCDFDEINAIAKKHGLFVIEDAAQSVGATYKGKYAGTLADVGVFSLNRHKIINCGEGGVICTNNDELALKLRLLCNHAEAVVNDMCARGAALENQKLYAISTLVGMNLRMTELSAAVAREQLKKLESILKVYREQAKNYDVKVRPECEHAYYRYASTDERNYMDDGVVLRDGVEFTEKHHYIDPIYRMPLFRSLGYPDGLCPVCEDTEKNIVLAWLKEVP
jgi:dTDP-4-amino-4,6-dideoxygalactose transaminase